MNKKGFTLIEIITTISILSIIAVICIPKIGEAFKTTNADELETIRQNIADATEVYLNKDCGSITHDTLYKEESVKIYLNSIVDCGLLDSKIHNPMNNKYFNIDNEYIVVTVNEIGLLDYKFSFDS